MTEILTESFCERCGSRYTFESAVPKDRLRRVKVLSRGLKTFVLDDKTSLDEALAAARSDTDRDATSSQLDAFHKTFNFCMQCRQYTCPDCWNEAEGRCLTCAPLAHLASSSPFPALEPAAASPFTPPIVPAASSNGSAPYAATNGSAPAFDAVAANGLAPDDAVNGFDPIARLDALSRSAPPVSEPPAEVTPEAVVEAVTVAPEPEPVVEAVTVAPEPEPVVEAVTVAPEPEPVVEAVTVAPEPEPVVEAVTVAPEPEPVVEAVTVAPEPEPVVEAVTVAPEPEPVIEAAHLEPVIEPLDELVFEPADDHLLVPTGEPIEEIVLDLSPAPEPLDATATPLDAAPPAAAEPTIEHERTAAIAATGALMAGLQPGESIDDAIDAFEREEPVAGAEPQLVVVAEPEPVVVAEPEPEPEPVVVAEPEHEPVAAVELEPVAAVEPEPVVAVEPEPVVAVEPEPVAAVEPEPVVAVELEPVVAAEPEPVVVAEPEPIAAVVQPEPVVAPTPPAVDVVEQPTWTIVAPEAVPAGEPVVVPPVIVPPAADPQWPATPEWPTQQASPGLPYLNRPAVPTGGVEALWAASDREVTTAPVGDRPVAGVQACVSCGLSLSATARFCRRCGTAQH